MRHRFLNLIILVFCIFSSFLLAQTGSSNVSSQTCRSRKNDTVEKLLECIQEQSLWSHLVDFQNIADENPGPDGHGNRDTGTSGYYASVNYVAGIMRQAGYAVSIQEYPYKIPQVSGTPRFSSASKNYDLGREWFVARLSAGGEVTAPVQSIAGSNSGCTPEEFSSFVRGNIALLALGTCSFDTQVANATQAGASAVILHNDGTSVRLLQRPRPGDGVAFPARLKHPTSIPVLGVVSSSVASDLQSNSKSGRLRTALISVQTHTKFGTDYNLIADSPFGDPNQVVIVDAHLDSIYGAGILDNASGSSTAIEIALNLANTPTRNHLRFLWFGGEELGLYGSAFYTKHLSAEELSKIDFDIDIDVTATPNFDYLVADPAYAPNVKRFPKNVVPESKVGNQFLEDFFAQNGVPARSAWFGNDGTDSNSFSLVGVPNTGILTQQDCCKAAWEVAIWGGVRGNYEGKIPSFDGGCVDYPNRWCDNLANNDPTVLELASKAAAYAVFHLANYQFPNHP